MTEKYEGQNLGSIRRVAVIELEGLTIPSGNEFDLAAIIAQGGQLWGTIPFTAQTAAYEERRLNSRGSFYFEKEIKGLVPRIGAQTSALLSGYSGQHLAALVTDMNRVSRLVFPLTLTFILVVPSRANGYNGYQVTLVGSHTRESPFVTGVP